MRKIAFITDVHLGEFYPIENGVDAKKNFEIVLNDISAKGIKDIIIGGDIGDANWHQYFFDLLKPFDYELILGNHDNYEEIKCHFIKGELATELFYTKEDEHYKYIYLDSSKGEIDSTQLGWLKKELRAKKQIVIFIHHPILSVNTLVDSLYPLKNRSEIQKVLNQIDIPITVFCGHYHTDHEQVEDNITQIVTPAISYQLLKNTTTIEIDNKSFGYSVIEFRQESIKTELVNLLG
jgi:3',5'-cyclic-AMP phosphodiesterase